MKLAVVGSGYLAQTFREWGLLAGHKLCAIPQADLVWFAEDTPVDENGAADVAWVMTGIQDRFKWFIGGQTVLVSSQLPVGSTAKLAEMCQIHEPEWDIHFAYHPENIRSGHGLEDMLNATRLVVGCDSDEAREACIELFDSIKAPIHWMSIEAAEMVKHALNAYLALNIAFANEIGALCEKLHIPYSAVEAALRADPRVGQKVYLRAGEPFAMEHLGRDLRYLAEMVNYDDYHYTLLLAIESSNQGQRLRSQK